MKNYIRTCLSLDKETRGKIADLAKIIGASKSSVIKRAVNYFYIDIAKMMQEEKECI